MKENIIIGEQPNDDVLVTAVNSENVEDPSSSGSPYGKFKDATTLLNAYNNLQSEFTRKCQKISELEKEQHDNTEIVNNEVPCYEKEGWHEELVEFLNSHKSAKVFAKEIAQEISKDKVLACSPNSLNLAYARILDKNYRTKEDILADENLLNDYVASNPQIVNQIIKNHLINIPKTPTLISSSKGSAVGVSPVYKPNNLSEAGDMVRLLFN